MCTVVKKILRKRTLSSIMFSMKTQTFSKLLLNPKHSKMKMTNLFYQMLLLESQRLNYWLMVTISTYQFHPMVHKKMLHP